MSQTITVLYFAQTAELTGTRHEQWDWPEPQNLQHWKQALFQRHPELQSMASRLKVAINQHYAQSNDQIQAGDEVAVFEPVTGG